MKPMIGMNCNLCLRECSENAVEDITYERFKAATDFVFNFKISYSVGSNGSTVCQRCVKRIMEFFEYALKVKINQESLKTLVAEMKLEPICEETCPITVEPVQMAPDSNKLLSSSAEGLGTMDIKKQEHDIATVDALDTNYNMDAAAKDDAFDAARRRKYGVANTVNCPRCNDFFHNKSFLRVHMKEHLDCIDCGKLCTDRAALHAHTKNMHRPDRLMICEKCGKTFTHKNLRKHMKSTHGVAQAEPSQCQLCFKTFNLLASLKSHIKAIHKEAGRTFTCDVCHKDYPSSRSLRGHKARVHVETKYCCNICTKQLKSELNLKEHLATHTGVTLYECNVCGHNFNSKANMYAHIKRKHPVEWSEKQNHQHRQNVSI